jgi:hypothetical protein
MRPKHHVAGVLACLALVSCMDQQDTPVESRYELAAYTGGPDLSLCHLMPTRVRGKQVTLYPVKDYEDLLAIDEQGEIVCIDTTTNALELNMVAIPPITEPLCEICDGTPLPAEQWNVATRAHAIDRGEVTLSY